MPLKHSDEQQNGLKILSPTADNSKFHHWGIMVESIQPPHSSYQGPSAMVQTGFAVLHIGN